jgi:small multidrug resistance pump
VKWLVLFIGVFSNALASVLVKIAIISPRKFPSLDDPIVALANWPFWLGLFLYGIALLCFATALSQLPLNIAHPVFTAGAVATVSLFSYFLLGEKFSWIIFFGIFLVILGVILITLHSS